MRDVSSGTYFNFGIAAFRKFVREGKQDVDFFEASLFSKTKSKFLMDNLKKGNLLYIENAALFNDKFTGNDGKEKSRYRIQIYSYEFINQAEFNKLPEEKTVKKQEIIPEPEEEPSEEMEEEIPF